MKSRPILGSIVVPAVPPADWDRRLRDVLKDELLKEGIFGAEFAERSLSFQVPLNRTGRPWPKVAMFDGAAIDFSNVGGALHADYRIETAGRHRFAVLLSVAVGVIIPAAIAWSLVNGGVALAVLLAPGLLLPVFWLSGGPFKIAERRFRRWLEQSMARSLSA